ncbi:MAG: sigma-70 family RNA polymerase sigma factor [Saprospiraceae bacterium]
MSIEDIVLGCKEGNRKCQEALVQKFAPGLLAICQRYTSDIHKSQDVLQDTFYMIFKNLHTLHDPKAFFSWAKRIAINASLELLRKQHKFIFVEMEIANDMPSGSIPDVYSTMANAELIKLLQKLPKTLYLVFNLHVIEGYNHQEISDILQISESTSRASLFKARQRLMSQLNTTQTVDQNSIYFTDNIKQYGI